MEEADVMKIVYFGTDVFLSCFHYFAKYHEILALYTYHNDEDYFTEYGIVREADRLGIPVHYEDISEETTCKYFTEEGCRLFFVAEYNRLLPVPKELKAFKGINMHSSLLPVGRSYYPIEAAMERDLKETGITMHEIASRLDGGAVLDSYRVEISPERDSIDIYLECAKGAREMIGRMMEKFDEEWNAAREQPEDRRYPYWKRPKKEKLTITHSMTGKEAKECFRRYNQLVQVEIGGQEYFIRALDVGNASVEEDVRAIREDMVLYRVQDGHLRLILYIERGGIDET